MRAAGKPLRPTPHALHAVQRAPKILRRFFTAQAFRGNESVETTHPRPPRTGKETLRRGQTMVA
jgi:hypothetical protein